MSSTSLQGKVIAITGAASGIGLATAQECARRGASLALADIQFKAVDAAASAIESSLPHHIPIIATQLDVSDSAAVNAWIEEIISHFGHLDGAANVAGVITRPGTATSELFNNITDITDETWRFVLDVNLTGTFYCLRAQLKVMQRGASVVNVSSIAGLIGRQGLGAYSTSKHGVVGLTKSAAKEVGSKGIRVNAVAPGPISTPMMDQILGTATTNSTTNTYVHLPLQRMGVSEDIARTICFLLSDESAYTTGVVYPVDGGALC